MSGLKVTPEQLTHLGGAVSRASGQIHGEQQSLKAQLSPLFGADWAGAASSQFSALYEQFDRSAKGMTDALDGIGHLLSRAGLTYQEAESAIAASFR